MCEIVGTYILNQLRDTFKHHSVKLYRDDGLAVVKGLFDPETERKKKRFIKIFKNCGLKITIKGNLIILSFLDVTFKKIKNMFRKTTYEPYRKPDNQHVYIKVNSNHQPRYENFPIEQSFSDRFKSIGKR